MSNITESINNIIKSAKRTFYDNPIYGGLLIVLFTICIQTAFEITKNKVITSNIHIKDIATLIISAIGIYLINQRIKRTDQQLILQERGNTADRFRNGIELLGKDNEAVIIGGIYLLHNLAKDHPKEYAKQVFEVFCGFLRTETKTHWEIHCHKHPLKEEGWKNHVETYEFKMNKVKSQAKSYSFPNKFQSLIDLIFKEQYEFYKKSIGEDFNVNLTNVYLINARFNNLNLDNVSFDNSTLTLSKFIRCQFHNCKLNNISAVWAEFNNSSFGKSSIEGSNFYQVLFSNSRFIGTHLSKCKLQFSKIHYCNFSSALLLQSNLFGSDIYKSQFFGAHLLHSNLQGTLVQTVYFTGARMETIHFEGAEMNHVYFEGTNLTRAHFEGSYLSNIYLFGAKTSKINLEGAIMNRNTIELHREYEKDKNAFLKSRSGQETEIDSTSFDSFLGPLTPKICFEINENLDRFKIGKKAKEYIWQNIDNLIGTPTQKNFVNGFGLLTKEKVQRILELQKDT